MATGQVTRNKGQMENEPIEINAADMTHEVKPYYLILLSVIHFAIMDYKTLGKKVKNNRYKNQWVDFVSAKNFLYSKNGLEAMLERCGMQDNLNISAIRRSAEDKLSVAKSRYMQKVDILND